MNRWLNSRLRPPRPLSLHLRMSHPRQQALHRHLSLKRCLSRPIGHQPEQPPHRCCPNLGRSQLQSRQRPVPALRKILQETHQTPSNRKKRLIQASKPSRTQIPLRYRNLLQLRYRSLLRLRYRNLFQMRCWNLLQLRYRSLFQMRCWNLLRLRYRSLFQMRYWSLLQLRYRNLFQIWERKRPLMQRLIPGVLMKQLIPNLRQPFHPARQKPQGQRPSNRHPAENRSLSNQSQPKLDPVNQSQQQASICWPVLTWTADSTGTSVTPGLHRPHSPSNRHQEMRP